MKLFSLPSALVAAALISGTHANSQDLMITGLMDGTLTGGEPKFIEVYAINNIPDLSRYAISLAANGSATFSAITSDYIFPAVSLSAGSFYYAVGNAFADQTVAFDSVFPAYSTSRARNFGANSNGDDVEGLFYDPTGLFTGGQTLIDVFGEVGIDGTGMAWEHTDGWAYSNNNRTPSAAFNVNDWTVSFNTMDNFTAGQIAEAFPDQTYTVVPEPTSTALLGLGLTAWLIRRRK